MILCVFVAERCKFVLGERMEKIFLRDLQD